MRIVKIKKKKLNPCEWSFLTITVTITTIKTLITEKTLTGEEKEKQKTNKQKNIHLFVTFKPICYLFIIIIVVIIIIIINIFIIIITIIIIIIDHVFYKTWFDEKSISVLFKRHCLSLLIRSYLIGKLY